MPTIIYTGDPVKCRQIDLIECPVCGKPFEVTDGPYLHSTLLDSDVKVCTDHVVLSIEDELKIQEALQQAMAHPRGRIQQDGKLVKRCELLEAINYKPKKDW